MRGLVIVVNYNQGAEIGGFLQKLLMHQDKTDVVLVDDGSTDDSLSIAESMGLKTLRHPQNRGVGAAIRTGIYFAREHGYDYVIINSSNGKMRPEDLHKFITPIENDQADYVTGSRFLEEGSSPGLTPFRSFAIPIFSLMMSLLLRRRFTDITCGYRSYRLGWLFQPDIHIEQDWLDRYELEYYIHFFACRKNLRILQVPVFILYDHLPKARRSKIRPVLDWWLMMRPIVFLVLGVKK